MKEIIEDPNEIIEYAEKLIHKNSTDLRELVFLSDDYKPDGLIIIANEIKHSAELLLEAARKLKEQN